MTSPHGLTRYKQHGCRCPQCREANNAWQRNQYRMAAYGRWEGWIDAAGTRRRIQALMWNGWSLGLLSARLGCSRQVLRLKLHDRGHVTAATAAAVRALCRELWQQPPPEETRFEKRAATMARKYARDRGWAPLAAWDAIDDPDATPAEGWERRSGKRGWGVLAEEAAELAGFGVVEPGHVAERLGVSASYLSTTLARARKREEARDAA